MPTLDIILEFDILGFIAILLACFTLGILVTFEVLRKIYREDYYRWRCRYLYLKKKLREYIDTNEKG